MDLKVFITNQDSTCDECGEHLGRSAQAKSLDDKSILLAVIAHIRHAETNYDEFLAQGLDRSLARDVVKDEIDNVLADWKVN